MNGEQLFSCVQGYGLVLRNTQVKILTETTPSWTDVSAGRPRLQDASEEAKDERDPIECDSPLISPSKPGTAGFSESQVALLDKVN